MLLHSSWTDDGDNNCIQIPTNWCLVCLVTCRSIHKSDFVHVTQSATPSMSPDQKCNSHRCNVQNNNNNNYIIFTGQWLVVCAPCVGISKPHNRTLNGLTKLHSTTLHHNPILYWWWATSRTLWWTMEGACGANIATIIVFHLLSFPVPVCPQITSRHN